MGQKKSISALSFFVGLSLLLPNFAQAKCSVIAIAHLSYNYTVKTEDSLELAMEKATEAVPGSSIDGWACGNDFASVVYSVDSNEDGYSIGRSYRFSNKEDALAGAQNSCTDCDALQITITGNGEVQ